MTQDTAPAPDAPIIYSVWPGKAKPLQLDSTCKGLVFPLPSYYSSFDVLMGIVKLRSVQVILIGSLDVSIDLRVLCSIIDCLSVYVARLSVSFFALSSISISFINVSSMMGDSSGSKLNLSESYSEKLTGNRVFVVKS